MAAMLTRATHILRKADGNISRYANHSLIYWSACGNYADRCLIGYLLATSSSRYLIKPQSTTLKRRAMQETKEIAYADNSRLMPARMLFVQLAKSMKTMLLEINKYVRTSVDLLDLW